MVISAIFATLSTDNSSSVDFPEIKDEASLDKGLQGDSIEISDSVTVNKTAESYINEEGKKTYVISVGDAPEISD